jgi:pilus assembly protein CpaB
MSSTTLRIVAAVAVLLALVLAAVGYQASKNYAARAEQAQVQAQVKSEQKLVVVALKPLAAYQPIARDAVALVPVPVPPVNGYTDIDQVLGHTPLVDIDAGAPVTQRYFREGNVLARIIPPGHQAISVEVSDVIAVGGFVRPGDVVDVLLYLRGGAGVGDPQSRVLLEAVRVLAYEERIIDRPEGLKPEEGEDKRRARARTAVLAVPEAQATRLMLGSSMGELRLSLRSQNPDVLAGEAGDGLPLSPEAKAADEARKVPDKAIGVAELARLRPPPAAEQKTAPPPRVEIIRGSQRETVTTH